MSEMLLMYMVQIWSGASSESQPLNKTSRLRKHAEVSEKPELANQTVMELGGGSHLRANKQSIGEAAGTWPSRPCLHAPDPSERLHTPQHPLYTLGAQLCPMIQQAWLSAACSRGD